MIDEQRLALFLMLGQCAASTIADSPELTPSDSLQLSPTYELAPLLPEPVRRSAEAATAYRMFFVFEGYLRDFVVTTLSVGDKTWWEHVPKDVQDDVVKLEDTEEAKSWMALGSRDKSSLMTYPQLLRVIEHNWKSHFEELLRDRALVQQARLIGHLRNTICHMSNISDEELERVKQTIRDWFRRIAP